MSVNDTIIERNKFRKLKGLINSIYVNQEISNFLKECYQLVKSAGIVNSQYQFSSEFLNANKFYYAKLISENKSPSLVCLSTLIENIGYLLPSVGTNYEYKSKLSSLYTKGQKLLKMKLLG